MNMKITWQGYDVRSCLRLVLNILNKMKGTTFIYTPFGDSSKKIPRRFYVCIE